MMIDTENLTVLGIVGLLYVVNVLSILSGLGIGVWIIRYMFKQDKD